MGQSFVALWGLQIAKPLEVVWVLILLFWGCLKSLWSFVLLFQKVQMRGFKEGTVLCEENLLFVWSWTFSLCGGPGRRSFAKEVMKHQAEFLKGTLMFSLLKVAFLGCGFTLKTSYQEHQVPAASTKEMEICFSEMLLLQPHPNAPLVFNF